MKTVVEVLQELDVDFRLPGQHHHTTWGWVNIECPLCSPASGHFRLGIPEGGRVANCWQCGRQRLGDALSLASGRPLGRVLRLLGDLDYSDAVPYERPAGRLVLPKGVGPLRPAHEDYLRRRRVDPDAARFLWGVQGIGVAPRLCWRLFLPVTERGQVVSWTTRSLSDRHARRYWSAARDEEALPHKSLLYGEELARHALLVCEGPLDALRVGPGAVATFGADWTAAQLLRASRYPVRLVCLDNEPGAQRQARKLCEALAVFPGVTRNVVLRSKDPGSASVRELRELRAMLR